MAEPQNSSGSSQPPPPAGNTSEEPDLDLEGIDFSQDFLESNFDEIQSQQPNEDSQGLHGVSDGHDPLSNVPSIAVPSLDACHGAFGPSLNTSSESKNTPKMQKTQSFATPTRGSDLFLHQTFVLRAAFRRTPNPSEFEIWNLCFETGLEEYQVHIWFQGERDLWSNITSIGLMTPETASSDVLPSCLCPNLNSGFDSVLQGEDSSVQDLQTNATGQKMESFFRDSRPRERPGSSHNSTSKLVAGDPSKRSRRRCDEESAGERYPCPSCSTKYKTIDQWHTHQKRTHFPTELFICGISVGKKPCELPPTHHFKRKDNFKTHLKDSHGYGPGRALDEELTKRVVKIEGLFHDKCGFCTKTLSSHGESMGHISAHIESGAEIKDWVHKCSSPDHNIPPLQDPVATNAPNNPVAVCADNDSANVDFAGQYKKLPNSIEPWRQRTWTDEGRAHWNWMDILRACPACRRSKIRVCDSPVIYSVFRHAYSRT